MLFFATADATLNSKIIIGSHNSHTIDDAIDETSATEAILALANLDLKRADSRTPIYLILNSPGGSVVHGERLIQFAKLIPNLHTVSIYAASMAHAIVQALSGTRYATENNQMMAHRAKGVFSGQFGEGEVESRLKLARQIIEAMEKRNAARIKISLKEYQKKVVNEWWTYGQHSVRENMVDKIIDLQCTKELIELKITKTIQGFFGTSTIEKSGCPLLN